MLRIILFLMVTFFITACSEPDEEVNTSVVNKYQAFSNLPTSPGQQIKLTGAMSWWFWEGDGGCFGTLTDGRVNVELHAEADLCETIKYDDGQEAAIIITFDPNKQFLAKNKKMYSIVEFIK